MQVKFFDLKKQNDEVNEEVAAEINEIISTNQFVLGDRTKKIEEDLAAYCGADYAVAVSSGTDALLIALMALDIKPGDEVITTPFTFFATVGSIVRAGAKPIFVDIDADTFNINPSEIEKKITGWTKAIIPVHLYGQTADMDSINELAGNHGITVIEDAAQAIGAALNGRKAGNIGDIGCFSFYPTKNLGGFGDSGMVTTNDEALYNKIVSLRNHGESERYYHDFVGGNFRMDNFQAAALGAKLKRLDGYIEKRRKNATLYFNEFSGSKTPITLPKESAGSFHTFNQFVITTEKRDEMKDYLQENGIGSAIYYPLCLHEQECFKYLGHSSGDFPVSEKTAKSCLALPIYPELTKKEIVYVSEKIKEFFTG